MAPPDNGETGVDPATSEIHIIFDWPMSTSGLSFMGGGRAYAKTRGRPTWRDDRTCVLSVSLEPEHEYWLIFNCDRFANLRHAAGERAVSLLVAQC